MCTCVLVYLCGGGKLWVVVTGGVGVGWWVGGWGRGAGVGWWVEVGVIGGGGLLVGDG